MRRRAGTWQGLGLALGATLAGLGAGAPAAASTALSFDGAQLGARLSDWKALEPPATAGAAARPLCSDDKVAEAALSPLRASDPAKVVCTYASVYGRDVILEPAPLDRRYRARDLFVEFDHGVMSDFRLDATVDAFDDVVALLDDAHGAPSRTVRERVRLDGMTLQQVREDWATPGGDIELVDPDRSPATLSVRFFSPRSGAAQGGVS